MMAAVTASMKERTGRTIEEWTAAVRESGVDPLDQSAVRRWLWEQHGLGQNTQWAIADASARAAGWERPSFDAHVDAGCRTDARLAGGHGAATYCALPHESAAIGEWPACRSVHGGGQPTRFSCPRRITTDR